MKLARLLACLVLAVAAINSAHVVAQQSNDTSAGTAAVTDQLAKELERCKALNDQAASDARCEAAYRESRQRFLQPPADYQPGTVDMFPQTGSQSWTTDPKPSSSPTGQ